ncbi:GDSL-like Lipase/Acylhydrolase [Xylariaceae sp. FL0016]|nr:GDSL-like Lipase/Acylhydrolase [Xylariaceae sp. FL0016]
MSSSRSSPQHRKKPSTTTNATTTLRILCMGNSLTSGHPSGHPYAHALKERLEKMLPEVKEVECVVEGLPGDMVAPGRGGFLGRMEGRWNEAKEPFDWTIVLGGTNDLPWGHTVPDTIQGLKNAWDVPLSRGGKVLALTIPDTKFQAPSLTEKRDAVNDAIKGYKKPNFFHFDLHAAVPYHAMPPSDRPKYWEMDGVHFSAAGYDLVGRRIADALARLIRLREAQDTDIMGDARQRRMIEELCYEEERGDPKLLSQGYIVVRKKDLD